MNETETETVETIEAVGKNIPILQSAPKREMILVDPDDILEDPDIKKLREWTGSSLQELDLPSLAQSMYEEGQLVACIVRLTDNGLLLVDGARRLAASKLIKKEADPEWRLWVEIQDLDDKTAKKVAIQATFKRANFTKIELARICQGLRAECPKEITSCQEWVADYLQVSPATVTQAERLLKLPLEIQAKVQNGTMSVDAALTLVQTEEAKLKEVADRAQQIADKRQAEQRQEKDRVEREKEERKAAKEAAKAAKKSKKPADTSETYETSETSPDPSAQPASGQEPQPKDEPEPGKESRSAASVESDTQNTTSRSTGPAPVSRKDITQAQREIPGAKTKVHAPKFADAIGLIESWTGPAYPKVMRDWAAGFVDWSHGKLEGGDGALELLWDEIADALPKRIKTDTKPKSKTENKIETKTDTRPDSKPASKPDAKKTGKVAKPAINKAAKSKKTGKVSKPKV